MFGTGAGGERTVDEAESGWGWAARERRDEVLEFGGEGGRAWGATSGGEDVVVGGGDEDVGTRGRHGRRVVCVCFCRVGCMRSLHIMSMFVND